MKMYLISDSADTLTGMRLAGVEGRLARSEAELSEALNEVLDDAEIGVVLVTEGLCLSFPAPVEQLKLSRRLPLLTEIPDRAPSGRRKDFISSYIHEALGLKL